MSLESNRAALAGARAILGNVPGIYPGPYPAKKSQKLRRSAQAQIGKQSSLGGGPRMETVIRSPETVFWSTRSPSLGTLAFRRTEGPLATPGAFSRGFLVF